MERRQSQVIYQAIADYLGESDSRANTVIDEVKELRSKVEALERKVNSLTSPQAGSQPASQPYNKSVAFLPARQQGMPLSELDDIDDEPDEILSDFLEPELPPQQQAEPSLVSKPGWSVYLYHPRGTVERIAGPFSHEAEARNEMTSQMDFGLFPEAKGYVWQCKEESTESR